MAVIAPVVVFLSLNMRGIQLADIQGRFALATAFRVRVVCMLAACAIILAYACITADRSAFLLWSVLLCRVVVEAVAEPLHTDLIGKHRYRSFAVTLALRSITSVLAFYLVARWSGIPIYAFGAWAAVWAAVLLLRDMRTNDVFRRLSDERQSWRSHVELVCVSLPLGFVALLNVLYSSVPLLFLKAALGVRAVGIYAAAGYVTLAVGLLVSSVALASARPMAEWYSHGMTARIWKEICGQLIFVGALCTPLALGFWLGGDLLLVRLYGIEMAGYGDVLTVQMLGISLMLGGRVLGTAATAIGRNVEQAVLGAGCITVVVGLCAWFVPSHGLLGAAWAVTAAYAMKCVALLVTLLRRMKRSDWGMTGAER